MRGPKSIAEFEKSLTDPQPPAHWPAHIQALWWDARGNWQGAHKCVDDLSTPESNWIHAYLHRKEGDLWNADYWYSRARKKRPSKDLKEEFRDILKALLVT